MSTSFHSLYILNTFRQVLRVASHKKHVDSNTTVYQSSAKLDQSSAKQVTHSHIKPNKSHTKESHTKYNNLHKETHEFHINPNNPQTKSHRSQTKSKQNHTEIKDSSQIQSSMISSQAPLSTSPQSTPSKHQNIKTHSHRKNAPYTAHTLKQVAHTTHNPIDCLNLLEINQKHHILPSYFNHQMLQKALFYATEPSDLLYLLPLALESMPQALLSTCQRMTQVASQSSSSSTHTTPMNTTGHLILARIHFDLQSYLRLDHAQQSYLHNQIHQQIQQAIELSQSIDEHIDICETFHYTGQSNDGNGSYDGYSNGYDG